jgi:hypothetical protein
MRARARLQTYGLPCECPIARHLMPFHIFVYVFILSSLPAPLCYYLMYIIRNECIVHVLFI